MKFIVFFFTILLVAVSSYALRSTKALSTKVESGAFTATLSEGFHFNDKAPNGVRVGEQLIKPLQFSAQKLSVALPAEVKGSVAYLYVCDDAVTFCETHEVALSASPKVQSAKSNVNPNKILQNSHGFILNNLEAALKKAETKKQIVLVDFGARWCPACLRLEDEIFSSAKFKKISRDLVKVKIDTDLFASSVLQDRYGVRGIPAVLFLNAKGQEIVRFGDYQPMATIESLISSVKENPQALVELEKNSSDENVAKVLWARYFAADQFEKSLQIMETLKVKPKEYLSAKIGLAAQKAKADEKLKDAQIATFRAAIKEEPSSTRSVVWRAELIGLLPEKSTEREVLAKESSELTTQILADEARLQKALETDSVGEYTGLERFYLSLMNADAASGAGIGEVQAWETVLAEGKKAGISAKQPGAALRLLSAMNQAKKFDESLELVSSLLKAKPNDGDLQRRKMRVLFELKRYPEAVTLGEKALKNSYGSNEFYVLETLIRSYIGLQQPEKAKKLLETYLTRNEINFSNMSSYKKKLGSLRAELETSTQAK